MPAATTASAQNSRLCRNVRYRISSLLKKPDSSGTPAIASAPMPMVAYVTGMYFLSPPIRRMSCSSFMAWITDPLPRKSSALKKAWVMRWNAPAAERADTGRQEHVAELRHGGVGEHPLDVGLHQPDRRGHDRRGPGR